MSSEQAPGTRARRLVCRALGHRIEHSASHTTGSWPRWTFCDRCGWQSPTEYGPDGIFSIHPDRRVAAEEVLALRRVICDYVVAISRAPGNRDEAEIDRASQALVASIFPTGRPSDGVA